MKQRCWRTLLTTFISALLLSVTLLIILYMKMIDDDIQAFSPQVYCGKSEITADMALKDFL
jgi:hypothetical protein